MSATDKRLSDNADTIMRYKELLDAGAITQEEFDSVKAQILSGQPEQPKDEAPEGEEEQVQSTSEAEDVSADTVDTAADVVDGAADAVDKTTDGQDHKDSKASEEGAGDKAEEVSKEKEPQSRSKTIYIVVIAAVAVVALIMFMTAVGNSVKYKGDVRGAVQYCQTLGRSENPMIQVSGYRSQYDDETYDNTVMIYDNENITYSDYHVYAVLKKTAYLGYADRVTVRGRVQSVSTDKDSIILTDAEVV